ncbi:Wall-associated protein precursor [Vitiosangium sp. GDMCC 1.1324]|uniref:Wall-associated protein precursor n=1 Tax=Vitiosangium sp. (strain GDMCC 1.1324) TaxID=2138576 RepID=UPI000D3CF317|nr:Wall-associated protein precursor [Vitiosangium sp. GDMCC 1.1324]PTL84872.1 Wall-associated protein precursor [Vitiosangium sp. GDMCC 1.1324]
MLSSLLWVLLTQIVACTPGETSLVCNCKAGMVSACVALVGEDALKAEQVLDEVQEGLEQASQMAGKADEKKQQQLQSAAESLSQSLGSSEPPQCKGQDHHPISRPIAKRLSRHTTLKGLYKPRDPRFVTRAKDEQSHCGYQQWHRDVDREVIDWLDRNSKATPEQFMDKLREIYSRPEMRARFPDGL